MDDTEAGAAAEGAASTDGAAGGVTVGTIDPPKNRKSGAEGQDTAKTSIGELKLVRGAVSGKPNASATALATDGVVATPLPIVVEQPAARTHQDRKSVV